ncbi:MAG TPA: autotransporter domain-containing protein [Humidesulfovibrio sp.]|uniref:autotransporter outer membrane beta-barrel domain-containing protein n=1 Tax=Humidesulfovibrio sp. TaxID=2910988 RepID=UPI002C5506B2|nr:autotransporter domain-containing protein [Humidesulfovibrio sp.]HWR02592.1 autotransporter domain-containing protein [Humidesulfovibrio sp.]
MKFRLIVSPLALCAAWLALIIYCAPGECRAADFSQSIVFGDSTQDSGYFRYNTTGSIAVDGAVSAAVSAGATGGYVGPGVMNSSTLAAKFGLSLAPVGAGSTNYANGGAYSVPLRSSPASAYSSGLFPANVSVSQEIQNYLAAVNGVANSKALYVISSGNNDLIFVQNQTAAWIAANPSFLRDQATSLAASVASLQAAGARTIVVPNMFNSAVYAALGGDIDPANAVLYARSVAYGNDRWAALTAAGVRFIPSDLDSVFRFVVKNPAQFGFTPASVLAANSPSGVSAIITTWANITPLQMQTYLFIDGKHMTTAGQTIEADYDYSLIVAPSQMSLISESVIQSGLARTATIQGQIDQSKQHRGPSGVNVWSSGGAGVQKSKNAKGFPEDSGVPLNGSLGVDYQLPDGAIIGAALSAGSQTQGFSSGGGKFEQTAEVLSLYAAYAAGSFWADVVASFGLQQNVINRKVKMGLFTDNNRANADGNSLALALRAGGDIPLGPVTTGPVVGMLLQRAYLNGFTETGTSGVTALSFGSQTRDSAVLQLGWRALLDLGQWQPFAEAKWNHECAETQRTVNASLTSVGVASYSMPAAPAPLDWTRAAIGTSYKLNPLTVLRGETSVVINRSQATSYGAELGINVTF